jgi:two-component system invasion response regulator UvrY
LHTVVVCDKEPVAIEGLRSLLGEAQGLRVVAGENSLTEGMEAVREFRPSVVILDKGFGMQAILEGLIPLERSASPTAVMVWGVGLTSYEGLRFLQAGVAGVIRKTSGLDSLLNCVRTVAGGGTWMEDDMARATTPQP